MNQTEKAIKFWKQVNQHFSTEQIANWIETLETGKGDWFRNYGFVNIALASRCRIGRIGFDQDKYEELQKWTDTLLEGCDLAKSQMQN